MRELVVTGINLFEGGPLSIYYDCLDAIIKSDIYKYYKLTAFVHKIDLFKNYSNSVIEFVELPNSRKSYAHRMYYEYLYFKKYSETHDIEIWLSLHDMTPNVMADKIFTYCHNVSPFIKRDLKNVKYSTTNVIFSYLYKYIYRINITKATGIIVQTDWMREEFLKMYPIKNVIVARPEVRKENYEYKYTMDKNESEKKIFIYPAFPRYFKNFEIICEAAKKIDKNKCQILLTLDGSENLYSQELYKKYKNIECISWIGIRPREEVFQLYDQADCLIFPSSMETWGLPISEFKQTGKDMILVDLPYTRETLGEYEKVMFFQQDDSMSLSRCIASIIEGKPLYTPIKEKPISPPFVKGWEELFSYIVKVHPTSANLY